MTEALKTHVLVVGGGPGGYVAAIRAGQLGLDTILVEGDKLGGTCLIRGCIPSKALIHVAEKFAGMVRASTAEGTLGIHLPAAPAIDFAETVRWKDGITAKLNGGVGVLLKKAKVKTVTGWATFSDGKTCSVETAEGTVTIKADHVILAQGSEPVELPMLPFGGNVISSTEALSLETLPKTMVVIGAGYIGLELGSAFAKLGVAVTALEARDRILPLYDDALAAPVRHWLDQAGVKLHLEASALGLDATGAVRVKGKDGNEFTLAADKVLVTVGRKPRTQGWGIETMAVDLEGRFVKVDDQCRTSMRDVWAIGDLVGEPMLAHKASAQGEMVAEIIAGHRRHFLPAGIPAVCFTDPEIVSIGLAPAEAEAQGIETVVGQFPYMANGRALTLEGDKEGGFVRVVARKSDHLVIGIQAVGSHVSELSGEFALALEMGAVLEDLAGTIHAHPTLSEAFHESALKALGHAIHI
jgi:dihydrolipoamide dehydrogenase